MKKFVDPAIHELLKSLADGRVFARRAPDDIKETSFVVFQKTDSTRWRSINGPSGMAQVFMQIDSYGAKPYDADELGGQIESILDGYRGTVYYGGNSPQDFVRIAGISLQNDVDIFDQTERPFLFRKSASYLITFEQ